MLGSLYYSSLQSCNCNNSNQATPGDLDVAPTPSDCVVTPDPIPILPAPNIAMFKAKVTIDPTTDDWLDTLGIERELDNTIIVNSANKVLEGGGGINGGLMKWANTRTSTVTKSWKDAPGVHLFNEVD